MRLDRIVLLVVCVVGGLMAGAYFVALLIGTVQSQGLLLPVLALFLVVVGILIAVIRQRMRSPEDDHYDKIRR